MSSSFLYLAIVAVWAFVLVPRWLRRQQTQRVEVDVEVDVEYEGDSEYAADRGTHYGDAYAAGYATYHSGTYPDMHGDYADAPDAYAGEHGDYAEVQGGYADAGGASARYSPAPMRRSRVLRARRRLLTMLLLVTAVAGGCTALKVTSWWVCVPPACLLVGYLLLLREVAVVDAEQTRRRSELEWRARAVRERAHAAAMERDAQPSAQIIDISARVGDQLYDQYADATVRAVGD